MSVICPECKRKFKYNCKYCPDCGCKMEEEKPGGLSYLIGIIFAGYLAYSTRDDNTKNVNTEVQKEIEKQPTTTAEEVIQVKSGEDVKVMQDSWCKLEYSDIGICITVKNNSKTDKECVKISVDLFDANGKLIKTVSEDMNDLRSEKKWNFGVPSVKGADSYKINDISYKEY